MYGNLQAGHILLHTHLDPPEPTSWSLTLHACFPRGTLCTTFNSDTNTQFREHVQSIRLAINQQKVNRTWTPTLFQQAQYDLSRAETDYVSCYEFLSGQMIILQSLTAVRQSVHAEGPQFRVIKRMPLVNWMTCQQQRTNIEKLRLLQLINAGLNSSNPFLPPIAVANGIVTCCCCQT